MRLARPAAQVQFLFDEGLAAHARVEEILHELHEAEAARAEGAADAAAGGELADEGAELRHHEILELDVERRSEDSYAAAFRNLIKFSNLEQAETTFKNLEALRQKFERDRDREGARQLRAKAQQARERANMIARNRNVKPEKQTEKAEIAEWFKIWLETPQIFFVERNGVCSRNEMPLDIKVF